MKKLIVLSLFTLILVSNITQAADEGIKVHGHWKFEIYNPDGSFDRKIEFENDLASSGSKHLLRMLDKESSIVEWQIALYSSTTGDYDVDGICRDNNVIGDCLIVEPSSSEPVSSATFRNLNYGLDDNFNPTKFILTGSVTAAQGLSANANIFHVLTHLSLCNTTLTPNCSTSNDLQIFSGKTLASFIAISSGQLVQVTVEISFS